jgi:spermidine synthase
VRSNLRHEEPFIIDDGEGRSLHFTLGEIQSRMRPDRPDELQLDYTRTMMGFLLLAPRPRKVAMVGLGGGSLVKFCHRYLPAVHVTVVDNNPGVVALRGEFGIPDDDARLSVLVDDGAAFMATAAARAFDVLLVDGFDADGQPPQLCSQAFYDDCFRVLAPGGVLVVNLHADHPDHDLLVDRIDSSFKGNAMQVLARDRCNCVLFAARGRPVNLQAMRGLEGPAALNAQVRQQLRSEFAYIGWNAAHLATKTGA